MKRRLQEGFNDDTLYDGPDIWDPSDLLHPAQAFEHPARVVDDPDLTLNEKRAILASWASDACAPESAPHLRCAPGGKKPVPFDDVMEALRALDKLARELGTDCYRNALRQSRFARRARPSPGERQSIN